MIILEEILQPLRFFCMKIAIKCRWHLELPLLVGYDQLCLLSNQIAGVFDHQYLWKESIAILVFLHGVIHQGKAASETITFGWVRSVVTFMQSICRIPLSSKSLEGIDQSLDFLHRINHQGQLC